jgi:hypothetical protein
VTALAAPYAARESRLLMAAVTDQKTVEFSGRCIYCGCRVYGRACGSHKDLLLIEQEAMAA